MSIIRCHQQSTVFSISPYIRKPSISVLYSAVLYCTVLYCTVLYCTVLHCIVLCFRVNGHCVDSIVEEWTRLLNVLRLTTIRTKPNSPLYTHLIQGLDTEKVQEEEVD